jgi:hypothetical protein
MSRQTKPKLQVTPQPHCLLDTANALICSSCSTMLSVHTRLRNAVSALQGCVYNALQSVLSGFILCRNIPAMPMTCSQVKHKSSGFFISSLLKKSASQCNATCVIGGCSDA